MFIIVKATMFYLMGNQKTIEFWCNKTEDYEDWFFKKTHKKNNVIYSVKFKTVRECTHEDTRKLPHYRGISI